MSSQKRGREVAFIATLLFLAIAALANPEEHNPKLVDFVRHYVSRELAVPWQDVTVSVIRVFPQSWEEKVPSKFLPASSLSKRGGMTTLTFNLGEPEKLGYVTIRYDAMYPVVVAKEHITPREALEGHVVLEKRSGRTLPFDVYHNLESVKNKESRFDIREGEILIPRQLADVQLVHSGDMCTVVVERGAVEIQAQGQATLGGKKDDLIPIRLAQSNKMIYAKVVDRRLVMLPSPDER